MIYGLLLLLNLKEQEDKYWENFNSDNNSIKSKSYEKKEITSEVFNRCGEVSQDKLREDVEHRKKIIEGLLTEISDTYAVIIIYKGKKKIVPKKVYDIICRGALLSPKSEYETEMIDMYNNGPYVEASKITTFSPEKIENLSSWDKIKISKMKKKIDKIKKSKNPFLDKKIKVTIDIFPVSYSILGRIFPEEQRENFYPDAVDYIEIECTPRELAEAGIDYRDLNWELIIENENTRHDELGHVRNTPVETTTGKTAVQAGPKEPTTVKLPEEH